MAIFNKLKQLDAHPKISEDFYSRTLSGGVITLVSSIFMFLLFVTEFRIYLSAQTQNQLVVDTSRGETLQINLDITFPALACSVVSLDAMDISGELHLDVRHNIYKKRLDVHGKAVDAPKPDAINAPKSDDQCCNSCEEVREAYRKKGWALTNTDLIDQCHREGFIERIKEEAGEGCNIYGKLEVNKVAGNFQIAPGKSFQQSAMHLLDLMGFVTDSFNVSHTINELSFGAYFPGAVNPLDKVTSIQKDQNGMFQYFIKVVPTVYTDIKGRKISTNQFSVMEHYTAGDHGPRVIPGVFFFYDLTPIKVKFTEERPSFLHFLTNVCAIIGGIYTIAGIVDSFIYHGHRAIKKKMELGKLS
uniref:Endoplasmic reticulum vesicle transporter C-terminal domain-containing protein n=1 Tax=Physcomitrium patens TaxID=3218 RepID=A0A7I4AZQ2_PHYPA